MTELFAGVSKPAGARPPRPARSARYERMAAPWVTTAVSCPSRGFIESIAARTRDVSWAHDSPLIPRGRSCPSTKMRSNNAESCARTSSTVRPSHSPKPSSARPSITSGSGVQRPGRLEGAPERRADDPVGRPVPVGQRRRLDSADLVQTPNRTDPASGARRWPSSDHVSPRPWPPGHGRVPRSTRLGAAPDDRCR